MMCSLSFRHRRRGGRVQLRHAWIRRGYAAAVAAFAVTALALAGQPAAAAAGAGPLPAAAQAPSVAQAPGGTAEKPAPVDPRRAQPRAVRHASEEGQHTVPNDL